jgi:hypothetical protein
MMPSSRAFSEKKRLYREMLDDGRVEKRKDFYWWAPHGKSTKLPKNHFHHSRG